MHVQSCRFALSSYCFFYFLVAASSWTSYYLRYIVIRQKHNFFSANRLLLIASETFFDSSVVPSFLIIGKLGERTGQLWRDNSRRVWTHEKNSGDAVRRLGTIIQSIFVLNQEPAFSWPFGNGPVRVGTQGLFRPCLKRFVAPFRAQLTVPGSPRMDSVVISSLSQDKKATTLQYMNWDLIGWNELRSIKSSFHLILPFYCLL